MSAGGAGAIGPVSVRYAAQIRELLFAQAMQRMAADQEAARAQAEADRASRVEPAADAKPVRKVEPAKTETRASAPDATSEAAPPPPAEPARIVDIHA